MELDIKELNPHMLEFTKDWQIGPLDFSISMHTVWLFISAIIVFLIFFLVSRRLKTIPGRFQNLIEVMVDFVRNSMVVDVIGEKGVSYFPFIATLFFFILISNLIGLVPIAKTSTSLLGNTVSWAIIVFILYNYLGIKEHGFIGYLKNFVPSGVPILMVPFMFLIEVVSHIFRPISLSVRLFANMLAGHTVLLVFITFAITAPLWAKILPLGVVIVLDLFEIFVAAIQAYIFAVLAAIYIDGAIRTDH